MLSRDEYYFAMKQGCQLWKHVLFIHRIIEGKTTVSSELCNHFKNANDYLIKRMREMGEKEMVQLLEG